MHGLNDKGFVFMHTLFDLLLMMIFLPLIVLFFGFMVSFSKETEAHLLEWQLFTTEFQSYLTAVDSLEIINSGGGIRVVQEGIEYDIELYANMVRKQKFSQGHEVMLTNIKNCRFEIRGNRILLHVQFLRGPDEEVEYVYTYPEV